MLANIDDNLKKIDAKVDRLGDELNVKLDTLFEVVRQRDAGGSRDIKLDRGIVLPELPIDTTSAFSLFVSKLNDSSFMAQMVS